MREDPRPRSEGRKRALLVLGGLYLIGAGLVLLWPNPVTTPFQELLSQASRAVPYGDQLLEVAANVILFVPAGWLAGALLPRRWRWLVIPGGILVSGAVELIQSLLLPGRVSSPRDVLANSLGAALGLLIAVAVDRHRSVDRGAPAPLADESAADSPNDPAWARPRLGMRIAAWVATGIVIAAIGLGSWLAIDAMRAREALTEVAGIAPRLMDALREDPASATAGFAELQDAAARAKAATTGLHWTVVGWLPWIGDNSRALQTVTSAVNSLATDGLPGLSTAAQALTPDRLTPKDGRIDTAALIEVRDAVVAGNTSVVAAYTSLAAIDRANLLPVIAEAVSRLQTELGEARGLTARAVTAVQVIPGFLGADGARSWLLLAQNNAELRATGGIVGAALLLRADDGALSIIEQRSSGDFGPYKESILPLTAAEQTLFTRQLGMFVQDVNLTPDFPRTAELASAMWQKETGRSPHNVMSLDPVALAGLLTATGPLEFEDVRGDTVKLTAGNAASFLMSGVYARYQDSDDQDAVFGLASKAVLKHLTSSRTDPVAAIRSLTDSIAQGRLLLWSADAAEQALLEEAGASGALRGDAETAEGVAPVAGVFLNLTTASKTGYYLDTAADIIGETTGPDGSRTLTLRATLTSLLKPGEADTLPEYVKWGNRDGKIRVNVLAYAPTGGAVTPLSTDWHGFVTEHDGLQVSAQTVKIPAGQTVQLTWQLTTGPGQPATPVVRVTPGARNP
ncbi:MAG TPA: DUF4012 domain-containing protein [Propionicimonas sp.]|nr:DUF4012 domain-containing protein [Propionicimonas sp.]